MRVGIRSVMKFPALCWNFGSSAKLSREGSTFRPKLLVVERVTRTLYGSDFESINNWML